ncbi:hypothetical protein VCHA53O466_50406 [Vibrio chagasii]|nr:hypothetical protein VCHA53O466_50406 [Vibrio chagasii]
MDKNSIVKEIAKGKFSSEELLSLGKVISQQIKENEQSEKVRIYSFNHCGTTQYFLTPEEVKEELLSEIQNYDAADIVGVEFEVGERYVPKVDLSEYIGKLFI